MIDLVMLGTCGRVLVSNGRGCYSDMGKVSLNEALDQFDEYAKWVRTGNRVNECDVSDDARALVIEAYRQGQIALDEGLKAGSDVVPVFGGAS